jgi:hypothetical protein
MSQDFHQIGPQIWERYKFGSLANLGALQIWWRVFQICPANLEHPCNLEANLLDLYHKFGTK